MARNMNRLGRPTGEECEYVRHDRARLKANVESGHFANRKGETNLHSGFGRAGPKFTEAPDLNRGRRGLGKGFFSEGGRASGSGGPIGRRRGF